MNKHSPGPWTVDPDWWWCVRGKAKPGYCGPIVVSLKEQTEEVRANARLIAMAPEMLRLLERLWSWIEGSPDAPAPLSMGADLEDLLKRLESK